MILQTYNNNNDNNNEKSNEWILVVKIYRNWPCKQIFTFVVSSKLVKIRKKPIKYIHLYTLNRWWRMPARVLGSSFTHQHL